MAIKLRSYRSRLMEKLSIPSEARHYINAALEDSTEMFFEAIKDVAQAHRMATVAKRSGLAREALYRSLSKRGNPSWKTVIAVLEVVGLEVPEVREIAATGSVPPVPRVRAGRKGKTGLNARNASKRKAPDNLAGSASAGVQLRLDFEPRQPLVPAAQQSLSGVWIVANAEPTPLLPPYLSSSLLERNYGYSNPASNVSAE